jgi:hypothetical protein
MKRNFFQPANTGINSVCHNLETGLNTLASFVLTPVIFTQNILTYF